ncbi:hypothetical protein KFE25_009645 [Diacronema lutheri]|uniref:Uncharacterized protein n=1 Tax=Diacronema lutheri TaxID=2081491 RepID=A0A8J5XV54_DIALT|nr:hypothetical protein KFE25_009645 [Diacronema lutheri]
MSAAQRRQQQEAYAEGFRAGLSRAQQAARVAKRVTARPTSAGEDGSPPLTLTLWSHDAEPTALATGVSPTSLTNMDLVLRVAALAGEALAWAVADECARNTALVLPAADVASCAAHALEHLGVYERAGVRRVPPTSVPRAELQDGLTWLRAVHADFARPSYARFHAVHDAELDAAFARAGAIVRALSAQGSGLRKNLHAVQLHARHARRAAAEHAGARYGGLGARGTGASADAHAHEVGAGPRNVAELEARVRALLGGADGDEDGALPPPPPSASALPAAAAAARGTPLANAPPRDATTTAKPPVATAALLSPSPSNAAPQPPQPTATGVPAQPQPPLALPELAARMRALVAQRDAAVRAELAAAAAKDYVQAAAHKTEADEAAEDAEDARVSAEARARRARERVLSARALLAVATRLELTAAMARDYVTGAARVARSRVALERELDEAVRAADYVAQLPARLAPPRLVGGQLRSFDVRWVADGADAGAGAHAHRPRLRFEGVVAYALQWAREDTIELRRPRAAVSPATAPTTKGAGAPAQRAGKPPAQGTGAPPAQGTGAHGAAGAAGADGTAQMAQLWAALAALVPEILSPAVRSLVVRGVPAGSRPLPAQRDAAPGGKGGADAQPAAAATCAAAAPGGPRADAATAGPPDSAARAAVANASAWRLTLIWRGQSAGSPPDGARLSPGGAGVERSVQTRIVPVHAELAHAIRALGDSTTERPPDDTAFTVDAGGGELRCPIEDLPLELERDGVPVPNAALPTPVDAPPAAPAVAPAAGAAASTAGMGGAPSASAAAPPATTPAALSVFRACRVAPLEPGVAYRLRVIAVSAANLDGAPSAELRCTTAAT